MRNNNSKLKSQKTVGNIVKSFGENTTAHGVPRITRAKSKKVRFVWILICLACSALFIWQSTSIVTRYLRYEKIMRIELQFQTVPFPSVTICNMNPYKKSLASQVDGLSDIIAAFNTESSKLNEMKIKPNKKREIRTAYEERYSPAYVACYCFNTSDPVECLAIPGKVPTENDQICMCNYDHNTAWPCYLKKFWVNLLCENNCGDISKCSNFTLNNNSSNLLVSCWCQTRRNLCISTQTKKELPKLWDTKPAVHPFLMFQEENKDLSAISSQAQDGMIYVAANIPEDTVKKISYKLEEFVIGCSFAQRDCNMSRDFKIHIDSKYGACYVFNIDAHYNRSSVRAGPMLGLSIVILIDAKEYLPMTTGKGARINIHAQDEYTFLDTMGFNAPPGFSTSFGLRQKKIERMSWPANECKNDEPIPKYIFEGYKYSTEGCYRHCLQKKLAEMCNCSDPLLPIYDNINHCKPGVAEQRICVQKVKDSLGDLDVTFAKDCNCKQPCNQIVFDATVTATTWPHSGSISVNKCTLTPVVNGSYFRVMKNYVLIQPNHVKVIFRFSVITCFEIAALFVDMFKICCNCRNHPEKKHVEDYAKAIKTPHGYNFVSSDGNGDIADDSNFKISE